MKKKLSILAVLVFAVAISTYSVGGTYAKYTTSKNVTGTATVAKWNIAMKSDGNAITDTTTVNLAAAINDANVANGRIAPGTNANFNFEIDGTGTEVAYNYKIVLSNFQNMPANFTITGATYDAVNGTYTIESTSPIAVDTTAGAQIVNASVTWAWPFETTPVDPATQADEDAEDTTDGTAGEAMTFDVTITATQAD